MSYPIEQETFKIKAKAILSIGLVDLGWFEILIIVSLFVVSGISITAWYYILRKRTRAAYKTIAGRDIEKLSTLLATNVKELEDWTHNPQSGLPLRAKTEIAFLIKKMNDTIAKMKKYLTREVNKLK